MSALDQKVEEARDLLRRTLRATEGPFNERLEALESAIAARATAPLADLLREMEWSGGGYCAECDGHPQVRGHAPDCRLGTLLGRLP